MCVRTRGNLGPISLAPWNLEPCSLTSLGVNVVQAGRSEVSFEHSLFAAWLLLRKLIIKPFQIYEILLVFYEESICTSRDKRPEGRDAGGTAFLESHSSSLLLALALLFCMLLSVIPPTFFLLKIFFIRLVSVTLSFRLDSRSSLVELLFSSSTPQASAS